MKRTTITIGKVRSALYFWARLLGDINAARRGRISERIGRRIAGKIAGRLLGLLFK